MKRFLPALLAATVLAGLPAAAQDMTFQRHRAADDAQGCLFRRSRRGGDHLQRRYLPVPGAVASRPPRWAARAPSPIAAPSCWPSIPAANSHEIGKNLYGFLVPAAVRIDPKDNIWAVDAYSGMIMKFDPTGSHIVMLLGRKPESIDVPEPPPRAPRWQRLPGAGGQQDLFDAPSDVAWDAAGNIFVADGTGNNTRIAKFTPDGVFTKSWGSKGTDNDKFAGVDSLQVDAQGNVYAADSGNHRIQVFDNNGTFKTTSASWAPRALCLTKGAHPYLYSSDSNPVNNIDNGGEIYKLELDGTVVGKFGRAGKLPKEFGTVNEIDCRTPNQLYVAEIGNYRSQKLTLK